MSSVEVGPGIRSTMYGVEWRGKGMVSLSVYCVFPTRSYSIQLSPKRRQSLASGWPGQASEDQIHMHSHPLMPGFVPPRFPLLLPPFHRASSPSLVRKD